MQERVTQLSNDAPALVRTQIALQVQPLLCTAGCRHVHRQQLEVILTLHTWTVISRNCVWER